MQLLTVAEYLTTWEGLDRTGIDIRQAVIVDDAKGRELAARRGIHYNCVQTEYGELAKLPVLLWDMLDM